MLTASSTIRRFGPAQTLLVRRHHARTKSDIDMTIADLRCAGLYERLPEQPAPSHFCLRLNVTDRTVRARHLITMFDTSGSMSDSSPEKADGRLSQLKLSQAALYTCAPERIEDMVAKHPELKEMYPVWRDGDVASLLEFNTQARVVLEPTPVGPDTQELILHRVNAMEARGQTDIEKAVDSMLAVARSRPEHPATCVLMTDGEDTQRLAERLADKWRRERIPFVARLRSLPADTTFIGICIGNNADTGTIKAICDECPRSLYVYVQEKDAGGSGKIAGMIMGGMREFVQQGLSARITLRFPPGSYRVLAQAGSEDDQAQQSPPKRQRYDGVMCRTNAERDAERDAFEDMEVTTDAEASGLYTRTKGVIVRNGETLSLPLTIPPLQPLTESPPPVEVSIELLLDGEPLLTEACTIDPPGPQTSPNPECVVSALRTIVAGANAEVAAALKGYNASPERAMAAVAQARAAVEGLARCLSEPVLVVPPPSDVRSMSCESDTVVVDWGADGPITAGEPRAVPSEAAAEVEACAGELERLHAKIKESAGDTRTLSDIAGMAAGDSQDYENGGVSLSAESRHTSSRTRTCSALTGDLARCRVVS